jgi:sugar (pentulose or hexulose) kinase
MEDIVLTVDCGTQSLRAMLFSRAGKLVDKVKVDYEPYLSPHPGWAEQDATVYWDALCAAANTLKARSGPAFARIQGVGVAALRNTPVLVDPDGEPVRPAILWLDTRKAGRVYRPGWTLRCLYAAIGILPAILKTQEDCTSNWVRQQQRELWDRTAKVLQVSGYLNHRLTGQFRDSIACQIGHIPFNYRKLRWCRPDELNARVFPVEPGKLPELVAPGSPIGRITRAAAAATGIPEGVPVIACASDKGAESLGTGCTCEAMASLSLGTAAAVQTTSRRYFEPLAFMPAYPSALPGQYSPEVQVFRGYWMINWFLREFAPAEREEARLKGVPPETLLDRFLRDIPAGSLGLMTLPHWGAQLKDPAAKGAMIGLGEVHTRGYFYRSLIEGLGFALRDGLERIERAGRIRCEQIGLAGGASQSEEICQITADIFGRPLCAGETFEAAGLGVAVLTAAGAGLHGSVVDAVRLMVRPGRTFTPRARNTELYRKLYLKVHRRIQRRLEPLHAQIRQILNYPERSAGEWSEAGGEG